MNAVVDTFVEITLKKPEDFLKVKETLSRIGIASKRDNTLVQSCHILHKRGRYFITHFKELFLLDGKPSDFDENDKARRNTICKLLDEWGLVVLVDPKKIEEPLATLSHIKIISFHDKSQWNLVAKYTIGRGH